MDNGTEGLIVGRRVSRGTMALYDYFCIRLTMNEASLKIQNKDDTRLRKRVRKRGEDGNGIG